VHDGKVCTVPYYNRRGRRQWMNVMERSSCTSYVGGGAGVDVPLRGRPWGHGSIVQGGEHCLGVEVDEVEADDEATMLK
jgi:hypothetical protein